MVDEGTHALLQYLGGRDPIAFSVEETALALADSRQELPCDERDALAERIYSEMTEAILATQIAVMRRHGWSEDTPPLRSIDEEKRKHAEHQARMAARAARQLAQPNRRTRAEDRARKAERRDQSSL